MNDIIDMYTSGILVPIEDLMKKQRNLVLRKGIFASRADKRHLKELENLWFEKLIRFGEIFEEEVEFYNTLTN